jgi:hypothetical protein
MKMRRQNKGYTLNINGQANITMKPNKNTCDYFEGLSQLMEVITNNCTSYCNKLDHPAEQTHGGFSNAALTK